MVPSAAGMSPAPITSVALPSANARMPMATRCAAPIPCIFPIPRVLTAADGISSPDAQLANERDVDPLLEAVR
jgi:hypothetical protein